MQKLIIVAMLLINANFVSAQTFDEWFKQKETQIKYLVEQIGALKAYGEVVNKSYDIAHNGLTNIFDSKGGDYLQHSNYFLSLWKVKPVIKNYSKVVSILKMKADIERQFQFIKSFAKEFLTAKEIGYIIKVYSNLVDECEDLTRELDMVMNNEQLKLKDDERIQRIDKVYLELQDRYEFSQSFSNEIRLLVTNRLKEKNEIDKLFSLYGIK